MKLMWKGKGLWEREAKQDLNDDKGTCRAKVAGGNDGDQQCRLGLLQEAWGAEGLKLSHKNGQAAQIEKREKEIQAVEATETMMRWQNKPVYHGGHHHLPDRFGGVCEWL